MAINSSFAQQNEPIAKISFFSGNVKVKIDTLWKDAELNMDLSQKDSIKTGKDSRMEITFFNHGIIRLDENSLLEICELIKVDDSLISKVKLVIGNIWVHLKGLLAGKDEFETNTPTAVASVRGTIYRMDVREDITTDVYVYKGKVEIKPWRMPKLQKKTKGKQGRFQWGKLKEIEGPKEISMEEWTVLVREMQKVSIKPNIATAPQVEDFSKEADEKNEWVQWNKERDEKEFGNH